MLKTAGFGLFGTVCLAGARCLVAGQGKADPSGEG